MKNIKICGFNIQLENILCVKIGNKKYNRKSYDKTKFKGESYNNFYNIIIRNVNRINYILVINHISDNNFYNNYFNVKLKYILEDKYCDCGILELYLMDGELHNLIGPAHILNNICSYYIHNIPFTYEQWINKDIVIQAQRREKINRVLNG